MKQELVTELADEDGMISVVEPELAFDFTIDIRDETMQMFETEDSRLLLRTAKMDTDVYVEPVPSPTGVSANICVNPTVESLTEITPASPVQPEVSSARSQLLTRMD